MRTRRLGRECAVVFTRGAEVGVFSSWLRAGTLAHSFCLDTGSLRGVVPDPGGQFM